MATWHDPWNMRLGGFVTSQSFTEAAANYEKERETNKEKSPTRRHAGRVRPRALPRHQQPRKRARPQDPPPDDSERNIASAVAHPYQDSHPANAPRLPPPPRPEDMEHSSDSDGEFVPTVYVSYCSSSSGQVREHSSSTSQFYKNKEAATRSCSLATCVSAWVLRGRVKMQRRHCAGPRNIFLKKKKKSKAFA